LWQQKKIDEAQNWDDFFDNVHVSRLDTPRLTALLKECVLNSQKRITIIMLASLKIHETPLCVYVIHHLAVFIKRVPIVQVDLNKHQVLNKNQRTFPLHFRQDSL